MLGKIQSAIKYLQVFATPADIVKFRQIYRNKIKDKTELIQIRVKEAKFPLYCRPNTTDAQVLWDTFFRKYHLPPTPLNNNPFIMDLGANVGYTIAHFAFLYPRSKIYGVEMNYDNFLVAQKNTERFGDQVTLINCAVWHENGIVSYGGDASWGFSITKQNSSDNILHSPAKTIDAIIDEYGISKIDYLKLDIEGAEKFVLKRSGKWMERTKSMKIEIHPPADFEESKKILEDEGFKCEKDTSSTLPCIIAIR
ncbi:MAG: FkbM family methyltransferase [Thermoproteota archaeon]